METVICLIIIGVALFQIHRLLGEMADAGASLFQEFACPVTPQKATVTRSKYFATGGNVNNNNNNSNGKTSAFATAAAKAGFKQTQSSLPEISDVPATPRVPVELSAREWIDSMTDELRFKCCLVNCAPLMAFAREKYGDAGIGGMTTTQVRAWLKKNPEHIPRPFRDIPFHIDHIIPDLCAGSLLNWPSNFMLVPKSVNLYFGSNVSAEKKRFVGKGGWQAASDFARWAGLKARAHVPYGQFDPISDHFLASRSR